jgi:hypothetical protein
MKRRQDEASSLTMAMPARIRHPLTQSETRNPPHPRRTPPSAIRPARATTQPYVPGVRAHPHLVSRNGRQTGSPVSHCARPCTILADRELLYAYVVVALRYEEARTSRDTRNHGIGVPVKDKVQAVFRPGCQAPDGFGFQSSKRMIPGALRADRSIAGDRRSHLVPRLRARYPEGQRSQSTRPLPGSEDHAQASTHRAPRHLAPPPPTP